MEMIRLQIQILILLAIGYLFGKKQWITQSGARQLNSLVMNLILPASIFRSFLSGADTQVIASSLHILMLSIIIQILMVLVSHWVCRSIKNRSQAVNLEYATMSNNSGTLGMIVAQAAFGEPGVLYSSIYVLPVRILMWSWGVALFNRDHKLKARDLIIKVLTNPCMIAIFLGIGMLFAAQSGFALPLWLDRTVASLAGCNTALIMIVIGVILSDIPVRSIFMPDVWLYCLLRLVLIPAAFWLLSQWIGIDGIPMAVCVLELAMPAPITMSMLAQRHDCDPAYSSKLIFLSTLLSMITLPVWAILLV